MKGPRLAYLFAGLPALWLAACSPGSGQGPPAVEEGRSAVAVTAEVAPAGQSEVADGVRVDSVLVEMGTAAGRITLELYPEKAPVTVGNFLRYVNLGHYDGSAFYRVVRLDNQKPSDIPIQVIQGGLLGDMMSGRADAAELDMSSMLPPIPHETTKQTGIRHVDGTISMARFTPGSASSEFFITLGDNAALDFGGMRNPDGQGFAAFGRVIEGMDVVRKIQALPSDTPLPENMAVVAGQILEEPLPIISARLHTSSDAAAAAAIIAEVQAWELEHDLVLRQRHGLAVPSVPATSLPDTSLAAIQTDADYVAGILQRIDALDLADLNETNHRAVVSLQAIQHTFRGMGRRGRAKENSRYSEG